MNKNILKHVLRNAVNFQGKANPNVVLGAVLKENPELKSNVPKLLQEINLIAKDVEKLSLEDIKEKLKEFPEELKKTEAVVEGPLKPLPDAKVGNVITRIAPSPSGLLHIGHIYGTSLNYEYAKMYKGKFLLRIEDTDPEKIYAPAYNLIPDDANWLTDNGVDEVILQSSRLGIYYDYAEKLVNMGKAYVCTCDADEWREMKKNAQACSCRSISVKENQQRYAKMFGSYAEGEAVLRLKTDIHDKNPAMRDFGVMRINEHIHPQTKKSQRVWPLMVFSVAVDDHEMGVTHVLNGKEHADNAAKEKMIMECFGWEYPTYRHWGRINFEGISVSKSKTKLAIEEGKYTGWDDIRLPFLQSLRKRGYQAAAFRRFALEIGLSLNDKTVSMEEFWKNINAFNKEIIEPKANRYFFIDEPVEIKIVGSPEKEVNMDLHPDFPERGKRKLFAKGPFLISQSDFQSLGEGYLHRLMDCFNFKLEGKKFHYISDSYEEYKHSSEKGKIIHWLPKEGNLNVEVLMDNNLLTKGLGESNLKAIKEGDIIQMERQFFVRCVKKEKDIIRCWYLHQ